MRAYDHASHQVAKEYGQSEDAGRQRAEEGHGKDNDDIEEKVPLNDHRNAPLRGNASPTDGVRASNEDGVVMVGDRRRRGKEKMSGAGVVANS